MVLIYFLLTLRPFSACNGTLFTISTIDRMMNRLFLGFGDVANHNPCITSAETFSTFMINWQRRFSEWSVNEWECVCARPLCSLAIAFSSLTHHVGPLICWYESHLKVVLGTWKIGQMKHASRVPPAVTFYRRKRPRLPKIPGHNSMTKHSMCCWVNKF